MKYSTIKKLMMTLAVLTLTVSAMGGTDITGTAPADGVSFGIYNVEQGQFLAVSGGKLTLASDRGSIVTLTEVTNDEAGSFTLTSGGETIGTNFQGGVTVGKAANTNWVFTPVKGETNVYTIGCREADANAVADIYYSTMTRSIEKSYEQSAISGHWMLVAEKDLPWIVTFDELATECTVPTDGEGKQYLVHLKRTLTKNSWNTICLPFAVTKEQLIGQFGDDVQLVAPAAYTDQTKTLTFVDALKDGIKAGSIYLIKPTNEKKTYYEFDGVTSFTSTPADQAVVGNVKFKGSFVSTTAPQNAYVIRNNKVYCLASEMAMKGFRGYFYSTDSSNSPIYFWTIEEEDPTGIEEVFKKQGAVDIYTIGGELVRQNATSTQGLLKGIYVVNGQKVLVK